MYYHVRITQASSQSRDETKTDLSEEELNERFLKPYELGASVIINGKTIPPDDIERIRISRSEPLAHHFIEILKAEDRASVFMSVGGPSYEWRAAKRAEDITDELILGPPGYKAKDRPAVEVIEVGERSATKIFVVHGHDHELKNDAEVFLKEIGLQPVVLHREPDEGLTVIEKFEKHADVGFALVLLTPDDVGFEASMLDLPEEERSYKHRARQNVIFELGYFVGKLGRSNVFYLYREGVKLPSDLLGLIYKKIEGSMEDVGYSLIREFKTAGLEVHID